MAGLGWPASASTPLQTQGVDFQVNQKAYPGYTVAPTEVGGFAGGWREVAGSFWTMQNADFIAGQWQLLNPNAPAWAFALLSGGGLAMYTAPANSTPGFVWTRNFFVDNTGTLQSPVGGSAIVINSKTDLSALKWYNFGFFGAVPGSPISTPNNNALTSMFLAMQGSSDPNPPSLAGGRAFIAAGSYLIDSIANTGGVFAQGGYNVPNQCVIEGSGTIAYGPGSTGGPTSSVKPNTMFLATAASASVSNTMFNLQQPHSSGGTVLRYLAFGFPQGVSNLSLAVALGGWGSKVEDCVFFNCPNAIYMNGLHCTVQNSAIQYQNNATGSAGNFGPNGGGTPQTALAQITMNSPQCTVSDCEMQQQPVNSGGCTGIAGIAVLGTGGGEHNVIRGVHFVDLSYGVTFALGGTQVYHTKIQNCEFASYITAIYGQMGGTGTNSALFGTRVSDCTLFQSQSSSSNTPVVFFDINSTATASNQCDDTVLQNLTVFSGNTYGLAIGAVSNFMVLGGSYCGNGTTGGAGIAIIPSAATGIQAATITLANVNLRPTYPNAPFSSHQSQQYALLISANPQQVIVHHCNMTGYGSPITGSGPVIVTGVPGSLLINDCPGYNDQSVSLNGGQAPTSAKSASNCTTPYYGPSRVTFQHTGPLTYSHGGLTGITVPANQLVELFLYSPYETWSLSTSTPAVFAWIGK